MTMIYAYETMLCPSERVPEFIADYLAGFGGGEHAPGKLPIRLQVGDLIVEQDVEAQITPRPGILGYQLFDLTWKPENEALFPRFKGTLSAADEGGGFCRLDLDGSYSPPLWPLGAAFDAALGHRIAEATVRDLLQRFKYHCEAAALAEPVSHPA
jgi:hypothetical protein